MNLLKECEKVDEYNPWSLFYNLVPTDWGQQLQHINVHHLQTADATDTDHLGLEGLEQLTFKCSLLFVGEEAACMEKIILD